MIKFFRKIRQNLLLENKTNKYFKYAIGEIVLVVIGILIALSINNWNNNSKEKKNIKNYYVRISNEIDLSMFNIKSFKESVDTLIILNKKSLQILNLKHKDSLIKLEETLGALGTAYTANFTFPIMDEFLKQGYLSKIKKDSIKIGFQGIKIFANSVIEIDNYVASQYNTSIEPFFYKNINYANVALGHAKKKLIAGGPKTDYSKFYNNLELYNLLSFKLESLLSQKQRVETLIRSLEYTQKKIKIEIKTND